MEMRIFGRTGLELSVLGFGCGAVGGLMVRLDLARSFEFGESLDIFTKHGRKPN
jgi:aryl-alcohol dehydrogenase-like predicted oxidoreductase